MTKRLPNSPAPDYMAVFPVHTSAGIAIPQARQRVLAAGHRLAHGDVMLSRHSLSDGFSFMIASVPIETAAKPLIPTVGPGMVGWMQGLARTKRRFTGQTKGN